MDRLVVALLIGAFVLGPQFAVAQERGGPPEETAVEMADTKAEHETLATQYQKKAAALTTETMDKAKKELTDDQKKAWTDLTGAAFDLTKVQPARPMRRDN